MRFLLPLIVILCLFSTVNANILMDLWNKLDAWFEEKSQEACAEWNKHPEDSQDYGFGYGVIDKLQDVINGTLKGIHYQALICRFGEDSVHLFKLLLEFLEPDFRY
ncbi:uncharacterized protein CELE_K08C9.10 [Caenorhabditis elegans]|uniref:Uncharacterized protein n=1 Tax=Caenorhabditis elegans TaxID=6239 RepID=B5BM40_CAEEL|nr:Uncharacterized protein CELE_K08C9.10 [Caenorhabditis elegans]CAR31493.1 Uncharacterized protein CELE_K08C9.10 [Caenorhabditis elegans]|eukprot:NP_001129783.1 Uncharacterized protein CELE_K08C9.10 [Caenorhabditis elegans]